MRAERLLNILTTLQARGHATATELATENEVSLRTIYRDIDNLALAGIPVYAERGAQGGYRLLNDYKVQLNGMNQGEVQALVLSGLGSSVRGLGLSAAVASAEKKFAAALPAGLRDEVTRLRRHFYLDSSAWFNDAEEPVFLASLFAAIWEQQRIRIHYRSWRRESDIALSPLGVVLKSGAWYLVANHDGELRTYRVARIQSLTLHTGDHQCPPGFDLATYWRDSQARLDAAMHPTVARVRVSSLGLRILPELCGSYARTRIEVSEAADTDGWYEVSLPVQQTEHAVSELLRLGAELEVLSPHDLREAMRQTVSSLHAFYT